MASSQLWRGSFRYWHRGLGVVLYQMVVGTPPFGTTAAPLKVHSAAAAATNTSVVNGGADSDGAGAAAGAGAGTCGAGSAASDASVAAGAEVRVPEYPELEKAILAGRDVVEWPDDVFGEEAECKQFIRCVHTPYACACVPRKLLTRAARRALLHPDPKLRLGAKGTAEVCCAAAA